MKRVLRPLLLALAVLATLVALFYAVENWRGARAWAQARQQLEARGESLDPATYFPPPVPDDQNLAMVPLFARALDYRPDPQSGDLAPTAHDTDNALRQWISDIPYGPAKALNIPRPPARPPSWQDAQRRDLSKWQQYYRARPDYPHAPEAQTPAADVLLALSVYDPVLGDLANAALTRPKTRFPVAWHHQPAWAVALPHYNLLQKLGTALTMRAVARLGHDQPTDALHDVELTLRLRQAAASDPIIIACLVANTLSAQALQPVWEGLLDRRWSAEQLRGLQRALGSIDTLAEYARGIRGGERALFMCSAMDDLKRHGRVVEFFQLMTRGPSEPPNKLPIPGWQSGLMPSGWIDQNKAASSRYYQTSILDVFDPVAHRVWVARGKEASARFGRGASSPYVFLVRMAEPVFRTLLMRMAWAQTATDQAATACALERYFLDHREYPPRLEALTPVYCERTPTDVFDGAPLRYRQTPDGRYQLYSIGWNEQDDGGIPGTAPEALQKGDWVWQYTSAAGK